MNNKLNKSVKLLNKNFDIIPNILEASFSTEMGWAIVKFEGTEKNLAKLFDYLRSWDVSINLR